MRKIASDWTWRLVIALLCGCGNGVGGAGAGGQDGGGGGGGLQISGKLPSSSPKSLRPNGLRLESATTAKRISHVMAVNPQTSAPDRVLSAVRSDGSFTLDVRAGRTYVLVFIDDSQIGTDMIVGIFKSETLDTLAPGLDAMGANLGTVTVDPMSQVASADISYDDLLAQLGLSAGAALTLGAVDDLSLRLTNPDIDGNGVIDVLEDHNYWVDIHTRTDSVRIGGANGAAAKISDITNRFLDATGSNAAYVTFNLASVYVQYKASFDSANYIESATGPGTLTNGAMFSATRADGTADGVPCSFSGGEYGDMRQWGPDYQLNSVQLPGSSGSPAKLVYGLSGGKSLVFPNLVTRTKAELESVGTIVPFVQLVTDSGAVDGKIKALKWQFKKRTSMSQWTDATDEEVKLIVNDNGVFVAFYLGAKSSAAGFVLERQAAGEIEWSATSATGSSASAEQIANATPGSICSMAVSYDDKLGLRIFAGNVDPINGPPCY